MAYNVLESFAHDLYSEGLKFYTRGTRRARGTCGIKSTLSSPQALQLPGRTESRLPPRIAGALPSGH